MNCFCRMVYRQKVCSLISSRDHCQRSSPSQILDPSRAEFEPVWKCRWSCAVVVTIKPWPQRGSLLKGRRLLYLLFDVLFKVPVKVCWGSMISFFPRLWPKNPIFFYLCWLCWLTVHHLHYCNNKWWFFGKYINFKPLLKTVMFCVLVIYEAINPLSGNPRKWSNTFKQFVGNLSTDCLSMLDHFVELALTESREVLLWWYTNSCTLRNKNIFLISGIPPSVSF